MRLEFFARVDEKSVFRSRSGSGVLFFPADCAAAERVLTHGWARTPIFPADCAAATSLDTQYRLSDTGTVTSNAPIFVELTGRHWAGAGKVFSRFCPVLGAALSDAAPRGGL